MLYLFLTLAAVLITVPLSLEWLTKGWHGTVVAKAWAEISPLFGAFLDRTRHVIRRISAEGEASAIVPVGSEAEAEQANTKPLSHAKATSAIKKADILLLIGFLFLITISGYQIYSILTLSDSVPWVDDKDRHFWPIVVPIVQISVLACAQYIFWSGFRLPIGATFVCLALLTGEWIDCYVGFWGWTYPITLVWPTSIIPMALYIDIVLLLSKSWIVTAIVGVMGYSLLMYANNWVILAPYYQPVEQYGFLLTLGHVMILHYNHASTAEYLGIIDRGYMRFFFGFIAVSVYVVSWHVSKIIIKLTQANVIFSRI